MARESRFYKQAARTSVILILLMNASCQDQAPMIANDPTHVKQTIGKSSCEVWAIANQEKSGLSTAKFYKEMQLDLSSIEINDATSCRVLKRALDYGLRIEIRNVRLSRNRVVDTYIKCNHLSIGRNEIGYLNPYTALRAMLKQTECRKRFGFLATMSDGFFHGEDLSGGFTREDAVASSRRSGMLSELDPDGDLLLIEHSDSHTMKMLCAFVTDDHTTPLHGNDAIELSKYCIGRIV